MITQKQRIEEAKALVAEMDHDCHKPEYEFGMGGCRACRVQLSINSAEYTETRRGR